MMNMRCAVRKWEFAAIVLCLNGCATPGGSDPRFRQAAPAYAPMPARAPGPVRIGNTYRPAGTTLYGAGEAAPHGEPLPRSPNKRVLPPTKEPGVWAADGARVSGAKQDTVRLLECTLPVPLTSEGHAMPELARLCVGYMKTILNEPTLRTAFPRMSSDAQQECLVAKMYYLCAETQRLTLPEPGGEAMSIEAKTIADDWRKRTGDLARVADAHKRKKCTPETETLAVRKAYMVVHREWLRQQPAAVVPND